jgi:hypothetical protein
VCLGAITVAVYVQIVVQGAIQFVAYENDRCCRRYAWLLRDVYLHVTVACQFRVEMQGYHFESCLLNIEVLHVRSDITNLEESAASS